MRILLISEFFPTRAIGDFTGGVEASSFFIARQLAKKHQVTVICSRTENAKSRQRMAGFTVIRVGRKRKYTSKIDPFRVFFIKEAICTGKKIAGDLVVGTNFICHLIAYQIAKAKDIPVIAWTPDVWQGKWREKMGIMAAIIGEALESYNLSRQGVHFIAISHAVANKLTKAGVVKSRITVIPCGVDFNFVNKLSVEKEDNPTVCTISRLVSYKKLDVLIKAIALIIEEIPNIKVKLIGQGPEQARLLELAEKLGVVKNIDFLGFLPSYQEVITKLKGSHLFVLPSTTEGFGIVTLEAMACGVPFVIADIDVNQEITAGKGGLFFKKDNSRDLADKVILLLKDKKMYNQKVAEGKTQAKKFDWQNIGRQTEKFYQSVINNYQSYKKVAYEDIDSD